MDEILFLLLAVHALCDYPLQGDFLAKAKNHNDTEIIKFMGKGFWLHALTSHSLIQGGGVALVTGIWWLGLMETVAHWLIDFGKCAGKYNIHYDQGLHVLCKIVWAFIAASYI
jgi:hypothetical protein